MYLLEFIYDGGTEPGNWRLIVTDNLSDNIIYGYDIIKGETRNFSWNKIRRLQYVPLEKLTDNRINNFEFEDLELSGVVATNQGLFGYKDEWQSYNQERTRIEAEIRQTADRLNELNKQLQQLC